MAKPLEKGERVTWKTSVRGKEKKMVGVFLRAEKSVGIVNVNGVELRIMLVRLNRCRGRKPAPAEGPF